MKLPNWARSATSWSAWPSGRRPATSSKPSPVVKWTRPDNNSRGLPIKSDNLPRLPAMPRVLSAVEPTAALDDSRPTLRLARQGLADPWPLTAEQRQYLVESLIRILASGSPRDTLAAASLLLEMDRINQEQERRDRMNPAP